MSVQQSLDQALVLGYRLEDFTVTGDVTDRPLTQSRARQPEDVAARLVDVALQSQFDFVVRQERHVAGMGDGQYLPVSQQSGPRLKQPERTKLTFLCRQCNNDF